MVDGEIIRRMNHAGSFYPGDALDLNRTIEGLFAEANDGTPTRPEKPRALIVPHAGYMYSGVVAAKAYRELEGHTYSKILMIGPYHFHSRDGVYFKGPAPALYDKLESPIGNIEYDKDSATKLASALKVDYQQTAHGGEHSLEVQLPFIGRILPGVPVSMLLMGDFAYEDTSRTAAKISELIEEDDYLVLISTDLSHFYPDKRAKELDEKSLSFIENGQPIELHEWDKAGGGLLCGIAGVLTVMQLAELKGWPVPVRLAYQTSGDRGGGRQRVVGYAALAYYES